MTSPDSTTPLKRCTVCGIEFPATLEYFGPDKSVSCGLLARCRTCRRETRSAYNKKYNAEYYNRPGIKERLLERQAKNGRMYRADPDVRKRLNVAEQENRKRRMADPVKAEKIRARGRAYYQTHKEQSRAGKRNRRAAAGHHSAADIEAIRVAQGNRCYICHKKLKAYHVDHFIPLALGGTNDPGNLRLACPKCNQSKSKKHPHDLGLLI